MTIKTATWLPGNGAQPEFQPWSQRRMAGSGLFGGRDLSTNWFHFPITTPVIVDDKRLLLTQVMVLYTMRHCTVEKIQLWSGSRRVIAFDAVQESGAIRDHALVERNAFLSRKTVFNVAADAFVDPMDFPQGLSISVKVKFDSTQLVHVLGSDQELQRNEGKIEFFSAGADWISSP